MSSHRVLVHTSNQALRWSDMDMLGHVNNVVYFRLMEQARVEWLYTLRGGSGFRDGLVAVIVNASCNFSVPLVYPGEVEVKMWLGEAGRTSVTSHYELSMQGRRHADGAAKIVWIDAQSGRPVALPEFVTARLRAET